MNIKIIKKKETEKDHKHEDVYINDIYKGYIIREKSNGKYHYCSKDINTNAHTRDRLLFDIIEYYKIELFQ